MHSTLKTEDPFNFSHFIGLHAHISHIEDFIYLLNFEMRFLSHVSTVYNTINEKYAMTDLRNWTKM